MKTLLIAATALFILAVSLPAVSDPAAEAIASSYDWQSEATAARKAGIPIMVVFSADHCPYCNRLKTEVLLPLVKSGKLQHRVLLREFNIDTGGKITDFDGEPVRSRIFVRRYDIFATPTVVLMDYEGEPLTEPIVGFNGPDSYTEHLDDAINSAVMTLAATRTPRYARQD